MALFTASFEGPVFNLDTFDAEFFIDSAKDLVKEELNKD